MKVLKVDRSIFSSLLYTDLGLDDICEAWFLFWTESFERLLLAESDIYIGYLGIGCSLGGFWAVDGGVGRGCEGL